MNGRRMLLFVVLAALLALSGSGCWDREELENLGFALSIGIDSLPRQQLEITVQVAIPALLVGGTASGQGRQGGSGPATMVVTQSAASIPEVFKAINRTINRRITLAQNRVIVFGEETARQGLGRFMSIFARYRDFRRTMQILIVKGRAKDVLNIKTEIETNPAEYLLDLARLAKYTGETELATVNEFIRNMEGDSASPFATYLLLPKEEAKGESGKAPAVQIAGIAVFRRDKMVGVYGPREVGAFRVISGTFTESFLGVPDPVAPGKRLIVHLTSASCRIRPYLRHGRATAKLEIKAEADLIGTETGFDYGTKSNERLVEQATARVIGRQIRSAITRAQHEFRTDPFGIGRHFRPLVPTWSAWRQLHWPERFVKLPIAIQIAVHLRRFGLQVESPTPMS